MEKIIKTQQTTDRRKSANSTNSLLIFTLSFIVQRWSVRKLKMLSEFFSFTLKEIRFGVGEELSKRITSSYALETKLDTEYLEIKSCFREKKKRNWF